MAALTTSVNVSSQRATSFKIPYPKVVTIDKMMANNMAQMLQHQQLRTIVLVQ